VKCYFLDSTAFVKLFVQEPGTDGLIRLMEATEDNRKLISAGTPLEVYAALKRRERDGGIAPADGEAARAILRAEAARMVQQPLNPAVLEAARQVLDRHELRSAEALQLGAAIVAREMFQGMEVVFLSADSRLLRAAVQEHFEVSNGNDGILSAPVE
jgi:predicted nucleic acid-binding protein